MFWVGFGVGIFVGILLLIIISVLYVSGREEDGDDIIEEKEI